MKIAAYCRVSTEKEAQIDSLEKQIEFFNEFTKKNGYELYKLYADEGISGKQIKHRKQFQQMMIDAKAKKFDKVVVKDVSRFARNTVDLLQSVRELKSYGVQVDFLNNGEVMEGGSEFILTILGAMAQQESANMSKRVKFGKDITAKKGRVPNLVFGYDKIPDERYTLKINEEEAKIEVLKLGADDFLLKPFNLEELQLKVERNIQKYLNFQHVSYKRKDEFKNIVLNHETREVFVGGQNVYFTSKEFDIIMLLIQNFNKVISKEKIFKEVWHEDYCIDTQTVTVHIKNIRKKIKEINPTTPTIETVWGIGFKIC